MRYLILALEDEDVSDPTEGDSEVDNLGLGDVTGNVPDMNHLRRWILRRLATMS